MRGSPRRFAMPRASSPSDSCVASACPLLPESSPRSRPRPSRGVAGSTPGPTPGAAQEASHVRIHRFASRIGPKETRHRLLPRNRFRLGALAARRNALSRARLRASTHGGHPIGRSSQTAVEAVPSSTAASREAPLRCWRLREAGRNPRRETSHPDPTRPGNGRLSTTSPAQSAWRIDSALLTSNFIGSSTASF